MWCVGARLRHTDATRISIEPLLEPKEVRDKGAGQGFLEVNGEITKTSHTKAKSRRTTPMVAHSWGLSTNAWGPTWLKTRQKTDGTQPWMKP